MSVVLMLGSAPSVTSCRDWTRAPFDSIVAINNAWQVRSDWNYLVHPEDFPPERRPIASGSQRIVTAADYVPAQNAFGGFVYAGGTMAFTASYWALRALRPKVIAYLGCDMVYPSTSQNHFYGTGTADPLRADVTLRSLEAKSARLLVLAARQNCALVNLSNGPSRLVFPRAGREALAGARVGPLAQDVADAALQREAEAGYLVASGRYWKEEARFDTEVIDAIDALWLAAAAPAFADLPLSA
jgi:hypothetical protein